VTARFIRFVALASLLALSAGCGDVAQTGRAPVTVVVQKLEVAQGATPDKLGGVLLSDVITKGSTFNDVGKVTLSLLLKNPGAPGIASSPSDLNAVTIDRYRVTYRRSDGRNTQGVDVPYTFDSALTFTIPADGVVTAGFQIVRHSAKEEAPLKALGFSGDIISTIAEVTFYGRDQVGNEVSASATVGIDFGDFADPA